MTVKDNIGQLSSDLPVGANYLDEISTNVSNVRATIQKLKQEIQSSNVANDKGFSFLELKNQLFMSYLTNATFTSLLKLSGIKFKDHPCIERLVNLRVFLERIIPLEDKLKHQVDKSLKVALDGPPKLADPTTVKNPISNIDFSSDDEDNDEVKVSFNKKRKGRNDDMDDSDDDEEAEEGEQQGDGVYKAPHVNKVHYPGDPKALERARLRRAKALTSTAVRDQLEEQVDLPEVSSEFNVLHSKAYKIRKDLEDYEEDAMTRVVLTKKQQAHLESTSSGSNTKKELLSFKGLEMLSRDADEWGQEAVDEMEGREGRKRQKRSSKGKGEKGKNKSKKRKKGIGALM